MLEQLWDEQRIDPGGDGVEPAQPRRGAQDLTEALRIRPADGGLDAVERRKLLVVADHDEIDVGKPPHEVLRVAAETGRDRDPHWYAGSADPEKACSSIARCVGLMSSGTSSAVEKRTSAVSTDVAASPPTSRARNSST